MKYTDLVFDLYGTLVDIHTEESDLVWEKTALFFGFHGVPCTGSGLKETFSGAMSAREAKAGQTYECFPDIPFEEVMSQLFRDGGVEENTDSLGFQAAQLFRICSIEYIRRYPHVREALATLRKAGCRLWLLSNAQRVFTAYELKLLELDALFDGIYISSDYQCRKPDIRFFQALLKEQHLDPSRCLMIGNDRNTDIAGARNAGLDTLYMHTQLTPADQEAADPALLPGSALSVHHWEFEGDDWQQLTPLLLDLIQA